MATPALETTDSIFQQARSPKPTNAKSLVAHSWLKLLDSSLPWLESTTRLLILHCLEPEPVRLYG